MVAGHRPDRITLGVAPDPVYECHPELYRSVVKYASDNGDLPIAMDLAGSSEEYRFVKYGAPSGLDEDLGMQASWKFRHGFPLLQLLSTMC